MLEKSQHHYNLKSFSIAKILQNKENLGSTTMYQNQATYSKLQYPSPMERVAKHKDPHLYSTLSDK